MNFLIPPNKQQFAKLISVLNGQIELLSEFKAPAIQSWRIDWSKVDLLAATNNWESHPLFEGLHEKKASPGIYYFATKRYCSTDIHDAFVRSKIETSKIRINKGVKHPSYFSISHVPKNYRKTKCIYAGSIKKDLYGRLISHLGYGSKRTGALFLRNVLSALEKKTDIYFNYFLIDLKFRPITELIERVFQEHLTPLIGQKANKNLIITPKI
jgi:hypothetical protein